MKPLLIAILVLNTCLLYGQGKFATAIYRAQTNECNVDRTITYSYLLQVFSDKTVSLDIYTAHYKYMSVRFCKRTFTGKATISNNTLQTEWLNTSFVAIENYKSVARDYETPIVKATVLPPTAYVVKNQSISPTNGLWPTMGEISLDELVVFENEFNKMIGKSNRKFGQGIIQ